MKTPLWLAFGLLVAGYAFTPASAHAADELLTYRGKVEAAKGDPEETRKTFELKYLVFGVGPVSDSAKAAIEGKPGAAGKAVNLHDGPTTYWTLSESGHGGWQWPLRFGQWSDRTTQTPAGGPSLLYVREETPWPIPLIAPRLADYQKLAADEKWSDGRLECTVIGKSMASGVSCWRVEVRGPAGVKRMLWIDPERRVLIKMTETVFVGPGIELRLEMELASTETLSRDKTYPSLASFSEMKKLRDKLALPERPFSIVWNEKQLATLKAELPRLTMLTAETPLAEIVKSASEDSSSQKSRAGAEEDLAKSSIGRSVAALKIPALASSDEPIKIGDLKGKVIVLHLWDYRDKPLLEPYGQVGYVDHLYRKRKTEGVAVYGVAVDDRFAGADKRDEAARGVRKLREFMNLSYPQLADDGLAIKELGDPRPIGGKLPLTIVIGKDGKIAHWHAGLYPVNPSQGLEALDKAVSAALEK